MKRRVLKCMSCTRLTEIQELASRPLPEEKGVKTTNRLGCRYCGQLSFTIVLEG